MVIGRGCHRKHPKDTSEVVTWPSVTTGVAQLLVAHAHTQGNPEGVKFPSHPVAMLLLLRKKRGGKWGMRRTYFRTGPLLDRASSGQGPFGHVTLSLLVKRPHKGGYGATSGCACAHPRELRRDQVPSVTSGSHVTTVLLLRKNAGETWHAQNILPVSATSGQGLFRSRD